MKKILVTLALVMGIVGVTAAPAYAAILGSVVNSYSAGCGAMAANVAVNRSDTVTNYHEGWVRFTVKTSTPNTCAYDVYLDYLHLYKNGSQVQAIQPDRWDGIGVGGSYRTYSTDWATACHPGDKYRADARFRFRWYDSTSSSWPNVAGTGAFQTQSSLVFQDNSCA